MDFMWELVKNAESQTSCETHSIRICILTRSSVDLCTQQNLRSTVHMSCMKNNGTPEIYDGKRSVGSDKVSEGNDNFFLWDMTLSYFLINLQNGS